MIKHLLNIVFLTVLTASVSAQKPSVEIGKEPEKEITPTPPPVKRPVKKQDWDEAYKSINSSIVSDTSLSFNTDGGTETILVYPDDWTFTVSSNQSWCTAFPVKSTNSDDFSKLIVQCETNLSSSERMTSLSIIADNKQVTINVAQIPGKLDESWRTKIRSAMNANPTYPFDNGDAYKGEKNNTGINGLGAYHWNTGKIYFGEWNQNKKSGTGIYIYKDFDTEDIDCDCRGCKIYVGGYSNDKISGQGSCYDRTGKLIYRGAFADGKRAGAYTATNSDYDTFRFQVIHYSNGVYIGETKNGNKHGRGILIGNDGSMWYGPYTDDSQNGYGVTISHDGNVQTAWKEPEQVTVAVPVLMEEPGISQTDLAIVSEPIFFDHGESTLKSEAMEVLDRKIAILKKYPEVKIVIAGNTDDNGGDKVNVPLGQRRSDATRDYLENNGINGSRITTITQGANYPMAPNTNKQNRAKNNRCDFKPWGF